MRAREACKLQYLTAGAVIVYGIPVFNNHADDSSKPSKIKESPEVIIIDD